MEERNIIIKKIKDKLKTDLVPTNICSLTLDEYRNFVISLFEYINSYKDKYVLTYHDFREYADTIYRENEFEDDCLERLAFIIDELGVFYTQSPHFWDSSFENFKDKMIRNISKGSGL